MFPVVLLGLPHYPNLTGFQSAKSSVASGAPALRALAHSMQVYGRWPKKSGGRPSFRPAWRRATQKLASNPGKARRLIGPLLIQRSRGALPTWVPQGFRAHPPTSEGSSRAHRGRYREVGQSDQVSRHQGGLMPLQLPIFRNVPFASMAPLGHQETP